MEAFLTVRKKDSKTEEFVLNEISGANQFSYSFSSKDELFDYLKNNIPVTDRNFKLTIDNELNGNHKILLKHSTEKAAIYQKKHGFDAAAFERKKDVVSVLQDSNIPLDEQSEKIKEILNIPAETPDNQDGSAQPKIEKVLLVLLAESSIELYHRLFTNLQGETEEQKIMNVSDKVLSNLRDNFNLLIRNDYVAHTYKNNYVDIIVLRNNISKVFMNKLNRIKRMSQNT